MTMRKRNASRTASLARSRARSARLARARALAGGKTRRHKKHYKGGLIPLL